MREIICVMILALLVVESQAEIVASHHGLNDPQTQGWTRFRPFLDVATFPVANDFGLGVDAWSIDDNVGFGPPGHDGVYGVVLTPDQLMRAESYGWRYSANMRIVESDFGVTHDSITSFVITSNANYTMQFGRSASGNPLVMLTTGEDVGPTIEVDDPNNGYHLYEMIYNPTTDSVSLQIDGIIRAIGYLGRPGTGDLDLDNPMSTTGHVNFGSTSNNFTGQANYSFVQFEIVPEPSTLSLLLGFIYFLAIGRRALPKNTR